MQREFINTTNLTTRHKGVDNSTNDEYERERERLLDKE